jgi:hypothetical protein
MLLETLIGFVAVALAGTFAYIGAVVQEEEKRQARIPLIWESDHPWFQKANKLFNKTDVKSTDGDNT